MREGGRSRFSYLVDVPPGVTQADGADYLLWEDAEGGADIARGGGRLWRWEKKI